MKSTRVGILRVLSTDNESLLLAHEKILAEPYPQWILESRCIPDQYDGIHDQESFDRALPKILELAQSWQQDLDGLIVSCARDPGVELLRKKLIIPVVGAGEAAASLSLSLGRKIGVIGIESQAPEAYRKILGNHLIDYILPKGIGSTNDLQTSAGIDAILKAAGALKDEGCDVIAFACTGLSTAGAAGLLAGTGLPIVDAVEAVGTILDFKLRVRRRRNHV